MGQGESDSSTDEVPNEGYMPQALIYLYYTSSLPTASEDRYIFLPLLKKEIETQEVSLSLPNSYTAGNWNASSTSGLSILYSPPPIIHCTFSNKAINVWTHSYVYGKTDFIFRKQW